MNKNKCIICLITIIIVFNVSVCYGMSFKDGMKNITNYSDVQIRKVSLKKLWETFEKDTGYKRSYIELISYNNYRNKGMITILRSNEDEYKYYMGYDGTIKQLKNYIHESKKGDTAEKHGIEIEKDIKKREYKVYDKKRDYTFTWKAELDQDFALDYLGNGYYYATEYIEDDGKKEELKDIHDFGYTVLLNKDGKEIYKQNAVSERYRSFLTKKMNYIAFEVFENGMVLVSDWNKRNLEDSYSFLIKDDKIIAETNMPLILRSLDVRAIMLDDETIGIMSEGYIDDDEPLIKIYDMQLNLIAEIEAPLVSEGNYFSYQWTSDGCIMVVDDENLTVIATKEAVREEEELKAKPQEIVVYVDEKKVAFDVEPVQENDRVLVPMRGVFEALGAKVDWEEGRNTAIAEKDGTVIEVTIGSHQMLKNGEEIELDTAARMEGDRTLVPLRAVSEALGAKVEWEELLQTVYIEK